MKKNLLSCISTWIFSISCLLAFNGSQASRILGIFPFPGLSHFSFNAAVMRSLHDAGHDITVITSFPNQVAADNFTIIDSSKDSVILVDQSKWDEFSKDNAFDLLQTYSDLEKPYCQKVLNLKEIRDILNSKETQFDVIFFELYIVSKCFLHLAEKLNVPVIGTVTYRSWLLADRLIGNPFNPSHIPYDMLPTNTYDGFYDRVLNTWNVLLSSYFWYTDALPFLNEFLRKNENILRDYSTYLDIEPSLVFYNGHFSYLTRPMNPNAIEIGGIHIAKEKPLPQAFTSFIEEAEHGVILFSLGSIVSSLEQQQLTAFQEAFAEIPQRVIWKLGSKLENISDNVMLVDWIPQRDILAHQNVIAFISHCGQGGVNEAIHTGKPVIAVPLFSDQLMNAVTLEKLNVAVQLDVRSLSKQNVLNAINAVVDGGYREHMQQLSIRFKDRPMTPQETVVYWTEYVIRHNGAPHLQPIGSKLNWFQYFLLDVIGFFAILATLFVYMTYRLVKSVYSLSYNVGLVPSKLIY